MQGKGDACVAQAIESEIDAQNLIDRERLPGLAGRLAAGQVSVQDWISLATQNGEQGQPSPQGEEGDA